MLWQSSLLRQGQLVLGQEGSVCVQCKLVFQWHLMLFISMFPHGNWQTVVHVITLYVIPAKSLPA